jgi:hypothetical protein
MTGPKKLKRSAGASAATTPEPQSSDSLFKVGIDAKAWLKKQDKSKLWEKMHPAAEVCSAPGTQPLTLHTLDPSPSTLPPRSQTPEHQKP